MCDVITQRLNGCFIKLTYCTILLFASIEKNIAIVLFFLQKGKVTSDLILNELFKDVLCAGTYALELWKLRLQSRPEYGKYIVGYVQHQY